MEFENHDVMIPTLNSYTLSQHIPRAQLIIYPDSGHGEADAAKRKANRTPSGSRPEPKSRDGMNPSDRASARLDWGESFCILVGATGFEAADLLRPIGRPRQIRCDRERPRPAAQEPIEVSARHNPRRTGRFPQLAHS